ncbi:hypothetical protein ABIF65_011178 [Bradyrhizobium japonicum]|jgi:hypothetical protein|uniref:hypothetical protein n=1 Tax=Bradyrhizobium japonicum TaxID=375 RepID=UPI000483B021|nr:hypothetical protein [Bradyrhizobium japonicum]WLC03641.1 hypothetical protein QIH92_54145 [Bradyrhizobium japonicum USDA 123]MCP1748884.1 hypothetical protein [Bradyrhizobium japonicum]MCP1768903.1 hypothetical protein [Bradyrhizobium japonicum]MCP1784575.1 hypothetical protein [Bradyrhizobium japonicum]MCP1795081.1 hypothetical protein [Bradyrhizobium japonicum]
MGGKSRFGNLVVDSFVADGSGKVTSLVRSAIDGRHEVEVWNGSTIPYDVDVESTFPQGNNRLSFNPGGGSWTASILSLGDDETQDQNCALTVSDDAGRERIHCVTVKWKKAGRHVWKHASSNLPITLNVLIV